MNMFDVSISRKSIYFFMYILFLWFKKYRILNNFTVIVNRVQNDGKNVQFTFFETLLLYYYNNYLML